MTSTPTPAIPKFTAYQKFIIVILAIMQFTVVLDFVIISPLGDALMKSLELDTKHFGTVVSAYAFSAGIAGILAAGFADRFDRKRMLLFFYTGFLVGTLFCGLAKNFWSLFIARIISGLFGGVMISIVLAIITDLFELNQRGRVMGFVQMAFAASQILGVPAGLYLANHFGWEYSFFMIVVLGLVIWLWIFIQMKPINAHLALQKKQNPIQHLFKTLANTKYQTGLLAIAFLSIGGFMIMPFSSAFLVNNILITEDELPLVFLFTGMSTIIIMPIIGKLSDRFNRFQVFLWGSILTVIMALIYTHLTPVPLWQVVVVNMILFMGIMGRAIPANTLNTAVPELTDRGAYMSITSSMQQFAGGIGALIAGYIVVQPDKSSPLQHFDTLGIVVSIVTLICLWFVYRVYRMSIKS
jgi:predicted MFS family arabinose efflux permease